MARGGYRPNSGRPKGSTNKLDQEARKKAIETGISPLEYLLGVMRNPEMDLEKRIDAAKAAAPYVHARLQAVTHTGPDDGPVKINIGWIKD
jgi:hypothetical protein